MNRLLIIIPTEILTDVKDAATDAFGDVAHSAFVAAGSPTGAAPATHWWLAGVFSDEDVLKVAGLAAGFPTAHVESYDAVQQPARPWEVLAEMELKPLTVEWILQ